jgi:hypothetical protein
VLHTTFKLSLVFIVDGKSISACRERLRVLRFPYSCGFLRIFPGVSWLRSRDYKYRFRKWIQNLHPESKGELSFQDRDLSKDFALTIVLATDLTCLAEPKVFKSFVSGNNFGGADTGPPIWQVALAAIATPLDLDPVVFRGENGNRDYTCIASSLAGFSNPSWIGLTEARERFHPNSVETVLNIGCSGHFESRWPDRLGHILPVVRGMALTKMVLGQVNDARPTAVHMESPKQMRDESANTSLYYQYFSAPNVNSSYYDWSERTRAQIERGTEVYLRSPEIRGHVRTVAGKLQKLKNLATSQHNEAA